MFFQAIRSKAFAARRVKNRLEKITQTAVKPLADDMKRLNQEQLSIGMKTDGTWLPNYSPVSVSVYGKPPGKIKLHDTGDFYDGIRPEFTSTGFTLDSTDWKNEKLKADYGDEILGLSDFGLKEISRDALGQIQYGIRKEMDL